MTERMRKYFPFTQHADPLLKNPGSAGYISPLGSEYVEVEDWSKVLFCLLPPTPLPSLSRECWVPCASIVWFLNKATNPISGATSSRLHDCLGCGRKKERKGGVQPQRSSLLIGAACPMRQRPSCSREIIWKDARFIVGPDEVTIRRRPFIFFRKKTGAAAVMSCFPHAQDLLKKQDYQCPISKSWLGSRNETTGIETSDFLQFSLNEVSIHIFYFFLQDAKDVNSSKLFWGRLPIMTSSPSKKSADVSDEAQLHKVRTEST